MLFPTEKQDELINHEILVDFIEFLENEIGYEVLKELKKKFDDDRTKLRN